MFNFSNNQDHTNCPRCGYGTSSSSIGEGEQYDIDYMEYELESVEELVSHYIQHFKDNVKSNADLEQAVISLFNEACVYGGKQTLLDYLESTIQGLNFLYGKKED